MLKPLILILLSLLAAFVRAENLDQGQAQDNVQVSFSVIITGQSAGSLESMVVKGGSWFSVRKLVHTAVLVQHPKGNFLWDTGLGIEAESQMEAFNWLEKQLFKVEGLNPAALQLQKESFDTSSLLAIIPSHMHWDHASGIEDFSGVPVWVQKQEKEGAFAGGSPEFLHSQFDAPNINWRIIELAPHAHRGFDNSLDVFQDGSVVLVDLSGHTAGQLGMFLKAKDGKEYFFIGDTAWAKKGVDTNKGRPVFVDWAVGVDGDLEKNTQQLNTIHDLVSQNPDLVVVPAHDELVNLSLPIYPRFL